MNLWMMIGLQISKKVGRICVEEKLLPEPIELNLSILFYIKLAKITILCVEESLDPENFSWTDVPYASSSYLELGIPDHHWSCCCYHPSLQS